MNPPKVLIIAAYSPLNRGDGAIVASMRDAIRAIAPPADLRVHAFSTDATLLRQELNVRAYAGLFAVPVLGTWPRRLRWIVPNALIALLLLLAGLGRRRGLAVARHLLPGSTGRALRRMLQADVILGAGGGYLTDHYAAILPFTLLEFWIASRTGATVVLGAQTIGPIRRRWAVRLLSLSLTGVDEIQARDDYTVDFIAANTPTLLPLVRRVPDFAFGYRELDDSLLAGHARTEGQDVRVGVSVRSWRFPDSANPAEAMAAYDAAFAEAIQQFVRRGWSVMLVATNHPSHGSRDDDVAAGAAILERLPEADRARVDLVRERASAAQLRSLLATCDVFVGTRMHACIFAISVGVPTLLIPYEPKGTGLMASLGRLEDVCFPDPLEAELLVDGVDRLLAERARGEYQVDPALLGRLATGSVDGLRGWLA